MTEPAVVGNLQRSKDIVGELPIPILYCRQHPEIILSGHHRLAAGLTETQEVDVDEIAAANHISHEVAETLVIIEANTQRQVGPEEKKTTVLTLCRLLANDNPEEKVASIVVGLLKEDIDKSTLYEIIPDQYKAHTGRPKGVSASGNSGQSATPVPPTEAESRESEIFKRYGLEKHGKVWKKLRSGETGIAQMVVETYPEYWKARREIDGTTPIAQTKKAVDAATTEQVEGYAEDEERHDYSGHSKTMGESTPKSDTPAENSLQTLLAPFAHDLDAHFGHDNNIQVADELAYHPDALVSGWLILEAEGAGSASADNPKREEALMRLGYRLVHIPNRVIKDPDMREVLRQLVIIATEKHRQEIAA